MAVDTRDERAAIITYALPVGVFPNPDSDVDQADRQQVAFLYPGILAADAELAVGLVTIDPGTARHPYLSPGTARVPSLLPGTARHPYVTVDDA